ncbi:MAG: hypothetical protein HZA50_05300 [Planctomycetes bacterium]|nr:hypothetical protein [Planctomycetota bacterium]
MQEPEIERIVGQVARRMLLTRAAETGAVCATAGAIAGAALVAALSIGRVLPGWAAAICLAPIVCGMVVFSAACRRAMRLSRKQAAAVFIVLAGLGLVCAAAVWSGVFAAIPRWAGFALCLAVGALAGAVVELVGGTKPLASAIEVDLRAGLKEKFATAAELALAGGQPDAIQACVFDQAADAAQKAGLEQMGLWHRTRATIAAIVLSCCLAAALGLMPVIGLVDAGDQSGRTARALLNLPDGDVNKAINALTDRARQTDGQASQAFQAAAKVLNARDERQLADMIAKLEKMGYKLAAVMPPDIRQQLANQTGGGGGSGQTVKPTATIPATGQTIKPPPLAAADSFVPVPADSIRTDTADPAAQTGSPRRVPPFVNFPDAWSDARRRAANLLSAGKIPPEYRQLVRDFFDAAE